MLAALLGAKGLQMLKCESADDREIYEALRRVHLLGENLTGPFANLDTFVAAGESSCKSQVSEVFFFVRVADAILQRARTSLKDRGNYSASLEPYSRAQRSSSWMKLLPPWTTSEPNSCF